NTAGSSDLRSLSIWLDGAGLARNEMTAVTSDDAPVDEPSYPDGSRYVFAPQVQDVLFEYFDGESWQASWDGSQLGGADGNTPIGPPAAIAITITLRSSSGGGPDAAPARKYKHVVALPTSSVFTRSGLQRSGQGLGSALQSGQQNAPTNLTNAPDSSQQSGQPASGTGQ